MGISLCHPRKRYASGLSYSVQTFRVVSRPPEIRYLSMYRNRSTGLVCPFVVSVECCILVRLYIYNARHQTNIRAEPNMAHFDAVLSCSSNNLASVELQRGHTMVILDGVHHAPRPNVPYLKTFNRSLFVARFKQETHSDGLVKTSAYNVDLVELEAGHRRRMG